jgi:hypothetical protein
MDACNILYYLGAVITEEWYPVTILHAMTNHADCAQVQIAACLFLERVMLSTQDETTLSGQDFVLH